MVTCSSILLSPRMKPSCRKVRRKQTVILTTETIKKDVYVSIYSALMPFDYSTNYMFITFTSLHFSCNICRIYPKIYTQWTWPNSINPSRI